MLIILVTISSVLLFIAFITVIVFYIVTDPHPNLHFEEEEKRYFNVKTKQSEMFPNLTHKPCVQLSVIIPAYNEEDRLRVMLDEAVPYLVSRTGKNKEEFSFEVIIVDDGSRDRTYEIALDYAVSHPEAEIRVLKLSVNRGKGGAIRAGVLHCRGRHVLFADADGATRFSDLKKLEARLASRHTSADHPHREEAKGGDTAHSLLAMIVGSRAHLEQESIAQRSLFRTVLMKGFHAWVHALCPSPVKDTQCGFKLMTREAAHLLFSNLHVERWAFDVDLIFLARHFEVALAEVPVHWTEIDGSKLVPVFSWLQMAKDIFMIRFKYQFGIWKIEQLHKT